MRSKRGISNAVRVAGSGGCVSHYCLSQEPDQAVLGWPLAAERAWNQSGWGPEDADIAEIYDSYAAVTAIALEGIGIAEKGEGARWFAAGHGDPGGKLPMNTNGGLLSAGHTGVGGGTALLVEGIRQLLHRAPSTSARSKAASVPLSADRAAVTWMRRSCCSNAPEWEA